MFNETPFSDSDEEHHSATTRRPNRRSSKRQRASPSSPDAPPSLDSSLGESFVHLPHQKAFRTCATIEDMKGRDKPEGPTRGNSNAERSRNHGLQWNTTECRCLRCEVLRVGNMLAAHTKQNSTSTSSSSSSSSSGSNMNSVVIVVDLDNFGTRELSRGVTRKSAFLCHVGLVWGFYGGYYEQHFGGSPEEIACREPSSIANALASASRLRFTPCGGHPQAVDEVLAVAVDLLAGAAHKVVVLTRDKHLREFCRSHSMSVKKGSDVNVDDDGIRSGSVSFLDVAQFDQHKMALWDALRSLIAR